MPVSPRPDRDRAIERLLRDAHAVPAASPHGPCVDPEELAAWMDAGLPAGTSARIEAHLVSCAACRALLAAFARTEPAPPAAQGRGVFRVLLPVAAAAMLVLGVWLAGPRPGNLTPVSPVATTTERQLARADEAPAAASSEPARPAPAKAPAGQPGTGTPAVQRRVAAEAPAAVESMPRRDALDLERRQAEVAAPPPPASTAGAAVASPAAPRAEQFAADSRLAAAEAKVAATPSQPVTSPDGASRWRIAGSALEVSSDGGATWQAASGITAAEFASVTGSASPGAGVSWLVGREGLVLVTADGRRFSRASVPAAVPLTGVVPVDAATAEVRAADGQAWRTTDAGRTWVRVR